MPTEIVNKYRVRCITEDTEVYEWRDDTQGALTQCPNDPAHTIDLDSLAIVEKIEPQDVHVTAAELNIPVKQHGFPDYTGYNVFLKGYRFTADANTVTHHQIKYTSSMKLTGMGIRVDDRASNWDNIKVAIVDVDGVYYPAGSELVIFSDTFYMWPNRYFQERCPDAKDLYPGLYIQVTYDCQGNDNVAVLIEHYLRTTPA